eukprot:726029-Alexandrium_andersonii.AAC.1
MEACCWPCRAASRPWTCALQDHRAGRSLSLSASMRRRARPPSSRPRCASWAGPSRTSCAAPLPRRCARVAAG